MSDREAVAAFEWDARWKFVCGGLDYDTAGFAHTVLVSMRARLARPERPRRIFEATVQVAREAQLLSERRVLDSTPLYDAVATQDTVTLLRSSLRGLLREAESVDASGLVAELRAVLRRNDDYRAAGKPRCDWEDREASRALIDELATDVMSCLRVLEGRALDSSVARAGELCAVVVGQDLRQDEDDRFVIARRVAKDRIISTVDHEARHGRKTAARALDGYKGHLAVDPESELITNTIVTAGNVADGAVAEELITDLLEDGGEDGASPPPSVYGDSAYGSGAFQELLAAHGIESYCRIQRPTIPHNRFSKERFGIDLEGGTATCPNEVTVPIRHRTGGSGTAYFRSAWAAVRFAPAAPLRPTGAPSRWESTRPASRPPGRVRSPPGGSPTTGLSARSSSARWRIRPVAGMGAGGLAGRRGRRTSRRGRGAPRGGPEPPRWSSPVPSLQRRRCS